MNFNQTIANEMEHKARIILTPELKRMSLQQKPTLIILGGQPGSGKSNAIEIIAIRFHNDIIALNGDDFKPLYPNYDLINKRDPITTSEIVQPYSNHVVNTIKQELADKKYNMIIEGTMRTLEVPMSTINEFQDKGYSVEAYIVATNYYASRTGCLIRTENDILSNGTGRVVSSKNHDTAYSNIPHTLSELVKSKKLNNMTVVSRSGTILGELAKGDDVVSVYTSFREQLKPVEYIQINNDIVKIITMMRNREANKIEISDVVALKSDFENKYHHLNHESIKLTKHIIKEKELEL